MEEKKKKTMHLCVGLKSTQNFGNSLNSTVQVPFKYS